MILVSVGRVVRLKNTGEIGTINGVIDSKTVSVYLHETDTAIPVDIDNLEDPNQTQEKKIAGDFLEEHIPSETNVPMQFPDGGEGINLFFLPRADETDRQMDVHLANTEGFECSFTLSFHKQGRIIYKKHGVIKALSSIFIELFEKDNLSLNAYFEYELRRVIGSGTSTSKFGQVKLKPKTFFNKGKNYLSFPRSGYSYTLEQTLADEHVQSKAKDKMDVIEKPSLKPSNRVGTPSPMELAEFSTEIDIHIEALRADYEQMEAFEIFQVQLDAVDLYIKKALRLGVDKVYIIHGKGTGRLKKAVHEILENNPHVKSYNADYHQKYGVGGATEVIF